MRIRFGYELMYFCPQPTPMILMLHAHPSRIHDLVKADDIRLDPHGPATLYHDAYGNTCTRIEAPQGSIRISADAIIHDSGITEPEYLYAQEQPVSLLPSDVSIFLLDSRYCDTQPLMTDAWRLFGHVRAGWSRVQAICDFAHQHIKFGFPFARPTKTAWDAYTERQGVCRDFAHLAITFCRCLNIPARYCTGYLGNIGVAGVHAPETMDFAGWFEAYLGGSWHTFDPCNNQRRIGRILVARGRDAADVAISTAFGPNELRSVKVWTGEITEAAKPRVGGHSFLDQRFRPIDQYS